VQCAICGRECEQALPRQGGYCGEEHRQELLSRHDRLVEELRREDLRALPDPVGQADFERLVLKLAIHILAALRPGTRRLYEEAAPWLLEPLAMADELRTHVLPRLPASHLRRFADGSYAFVSPIPARVVLEAMTRAHVWPRLD
jgi:hypothetical protein